MKRPFLILCFSVIYQCSFAQSQEDAVKAGVNKLFTAMRNADSAKLISCFTETAVMQTITKSNTVRAVSVSEFAGSIARLPANAADERISFSQIHIDGTLASVWTPYRFYFKGQFSHCGVNSFQLINENGTWKIQYIIDTRRKDDCVPEESVSSPK
ncbi:nuclear transport factor 2 family protein [Chitinophaga sp. sic0106]|uniref:nuclear transport factor 2 family protein n=1 Tax=Chitinophaga sp. sic0106 TaxID=2854785 RepID=UPI001C48BB2A|nr:nuclear transport factor 2 family protein [Chitinophaga sp. sic0106]MBV7530153.1 nuclear transport factor 2 family protein [Chitinophaga sp. sic0106]